MFSYYKIVNSLEFTSDIIFNKKIKGDTAQGSCGLLIFKSDNIDENKEDEIVSCRELIIDFKTNLVFYKYGNSGSNCTLSRQEYIIGDSLVKSCSHFPNFMRPILYIKNHLIRTDSYEDPFNLETIKDKNYISCVDIVLFEYIESSITLWKILKKQDLTDEFKNSLIMQIFLSIIAAQQNVKFVHNDLHGNNILVIKCDKNLKILYRIKINGKEKFFLIPTFGYIPIIIDYGFSYTSECENMSLECADLDNYGLITYQFDSISDFIRLLVVICSVKYNEKISETIFNLFKDLPISMEKSWETQIVEDHSMSDIEDIFIKCYGYKNYKKNKKYCDQFLRLLLRNIILPVKYNKKYENVNPEESLTDFLFYWRDISKWLKYNFEKIFILREFIDSVRKHGYDYEVIDNILKKIYIISLVKIILLNTILNQ